MDLLLDSAQRHQNPKGLSLSHALLLLGALGRTGRLYGLSATATTRKIKWASFHRVLYHRTPEGLSEHKL